MSSNEVSRQPRARSLTARIINRVKSIVGSAAYAVKGLVTWPAHWRVHAYRTTRGFVVFCEWRPFRAAVLRPDIWRARETARLTEVESLDLIHD